MTRIAHIRTWTYITHKTSWTDEPEEWQHLARTIEDRLSDELHNRLTQRFVDKRAAHLSRRLKEATNLISSVKMDGTVIVEGEEVGTLKGFTFLPAISENDEKAMILAAARKALPDEIERRVLNVSRVSTVIIMLLCTLLAWQMLDMNVTIIVWIGTGCMMAAFSGPLILGAVWSGVTKAGAFAGLLSGGLVFMITFNAVIDPEWFSPGVLRDASVWLQKESANPWSCAAIGEVVSIALTVIVSKLTQQLPDEHIDNLFAPQR